jgi:aspartokinase-like uncharacterized kinase
MSGDAWTVVKVGGSLFDWPELGTRLGAWLNQLESNRVLLIPGGGLAAEAIRKLDQVHHLGAEASHWLAIQAMSLNARFLQVLLPAARIVADVLSPGSGATQRCLLDAFPFFRADEARADALPHTWQVTSDSLAVRAATLVNARELILLKSASWVGCDWAAATRAGFVDGYFAEALRLARKEMRVRAVNLRSWPGE